MKKVEFQVDTSKTRILEEYSNSTLAKAEFWIVSSGNNAHDMPITVDAIKSAMPTLVGKPILAKYNEYIHDFEGHEIDEVPVGVFLKEEDFRLVEEGDKTWCVAIGYIWKQYFPEVLEVFMKKDDATDVSMEIDILEFGEDERTIEMYSYSGVTLLGVEPAIENAKATIMQYSKNFSKMVDDVKKIVFGAMTYEVPQEVKENAIDAIGLAKRLKRKTSSDFLLMSELLSEKDKIAYEHVEAIYEFTKDKEEHAKKKRNTNDYIFFNGYGGIDALEWAKSIIEEHENSDGVGDDADLNINEPSAQSDFEENGHGKEKGMEKEKMMKDMMMKIMQKIMADDTMAEDMREMAKNIMEDEMMMNPMYEKAMGMMPEEEMAEDMMEKEMMGIMMGIMKEKMQEDDQGDDENNAYMEEEMEAMKEEMSKLSAQVEELTSEKETLLEENATLKEFKKEVEDAQYSKIVKDILSEAKEVVSEDDYKDLDEDSKNFSIETADTYVNKVKAKIFDTITSQKKEDDTERYAVFSKKANKNTNVDDNSWGALISTYKNEEKKEN